MATRSGRSTGGSPALADDHGVDVSGEASADELLVDADSRGQPVLSVVLPTMNEEAGIGTCIDWIKEAIEALQVPAEIIVSDSSTDRTPAIARERGAIVVEPDEPGYGYAYRYAFAEARGEYIAMGDADTTYDFRELPRLLEHLATTDADIVMGSRLNGEIEDGAMPPLHQYIGNPLLTGFLNFFYDAAVSDAHSGFRVFEREALETMDLETTGMEFASEMVMEAGAQDLTIKELPIVYHDRQGEETLQSFRDGWRHVRFMLVNTPGHLFVAPGALLVGLGLVILAVATTGTAIGDVTLGINSTIAGGLLTVLGYQVGLFGVLAVVADEPINGRSSRWSQFVRSQLTLERGASGGAVLFGAGALYAGTMAAEWVLSGFAAMPFTIGALAAFVAIVLGLQTVFAAFFLSVVGEQT